MTSTTAQLTNFTSLVASVLSLSHKLLRSREDRRDNALHEKQWALLAALDSHMLEDVGVKNFHKLPRLQQMEIAKQIVKSS